MLCLQPGFGCVKPCVCGGGIYYYPKQYKYFRIILLFAAVLTYLICGLMSGDGKKLQLMYLTSHQLGSISAATGFGVSLSSALETMG